MRVALFGGSFNPPHVAHQLVALYVLETAPIDQLWLAPCFKHPFDKALQPFEHRYRMCELAAQALGGRVKVTDVEQRLGGESRTLRTVKTLLAETPGLELSLVIGADIEAEISAWYGADELRALVPFIVVGRSGFGQEPLNMPAVSSTEIRRRLAAGQPVDAFVPRSVLDYIGRTGLYGPPE
jgi:nicotinate-nucleotide adenylyltransferase